MIALKQIAGKKFRREIFWEILMEFLFSLDHRILANIQNKDKFLRDKYF